MHFGLCAFPTEPSRAPADLAFAAEERGFESLRVAEHSHIPASRRSSFPGGGELPRICAEVDVSIHAASTEAPTLVRLREAGIARVAFFVPSSPRGRVLPLLDELSAIAREVG